MRTALGLTAALWTLVSLSAPRALHPCPTPAVAAGPQGAAPAHDAHEHGHAAHPMPAPPAADAAAAPAPDGDAPAPPHPCDCVDCGCAAAPLGAYAPPVTCFAIAAWPSIASPAARDAERPAVAVLERLPFAIGPPAQIG